MPMTRPSKPDPATSRREIAREIAERCGVSVSTVSRVLAGRTRGAYAKVAERNDLIRRIADELNYRPAYQGGSLRRRRTMNVALLYPGELPLLGQAYGRVVQAAIARLQQNGYHLTPWGLTVEDLARTDLFLDGRFDGLIAYHRLTDTVREAIFRSGLPAVAVNAEAPDELASVVPNDEAAAAEATRHLLGLGHRAIALLQPEGSEHFSVEARVAGFRAAMAEAGLPAHLCRSVLPLPERLRVRPKGLRLHELLADTPVTAIVTYRGYDALGVCHAARLAGVHIPEELSLITLSDESAIELAGPPITAVRVPFEQLGLTAADLLLRRIADRDAGSASTPPERVVLPERFIVRSSTAAAPKEPVATDRFRVADGQTDADPKESL